MEDAKIPAKVAADKKKAAEKKAAAAKKAKKTGSAVKKAAAAAAPGQQRTKKDAQEKATRADAEAAPPPAPAPTAAEKRKREQRENSDAKKSRKSAAASSAPKQTPGESPQSEVKTPIDAAAQGELQVFARLPEGRLVPICCSPAATVHDLIEEVRHAAGFRLAPRIRFLGKRLEASTPVADTGVTSVEW
eukprot:Hpha_TRINITY_DN16253_c1_g1::TRINITY_DN16253_c1_g1_i2::g.12157::m.12157